MNDVDIIPPVKMVSVEDIKPMLQNVGDAIANMFEQMVKGDWKDSMGHSVQQNQQMCLLGEQLMAMVKWRAKYLDYPDTTQPEMKTVGEGGDGLDQAVAIPSGT